MRDLSSLYPIWFCDIWGVLHDGHAPYAITVDCLQRHRKNGGTVVLVSNSPRSTIGVSKQLDEIGVARDCYDTAVTSGDVTRDLMQQTDGRLFHLGPSRDLSIFDGLSVNRVALEAASTVICTGLFHDDRETPADYAALLADIHARKLPMICANPDKVVRKGGRLQYCAGALAEAYAALGGEVRMAGKPFAPIYDLARRRAATIRDHDVPVSSILAIGDGPETDIRGAAGQGIACVFMTGLHDGEGSLADDDAAIRKAVPEANILRTVERLDW
ncbi:MAG: TIGR01459 family HAD-type hydrolase [Rhizobiales bacterium]|nr:TIGR01459 family HAD-type hydrolase [Hyphomicrobiales bacterium]